MCTPSIRLEMSCFLFWNVSKCLLVFKVKVTFDLPFFFSWCHPYLYLYFIQNLNLKFEFLREFLKINSLRSPSIHYFYKFRISKCNKQFEFALENWLLVLLEIWATAQFQWLNVGPLWMAWNWLKDSTLSS